MSLNSADRYAGPIELDTTTQIRACVVHEDKVLGPTVSETFIKISPEIADWSSNLPIMVVENFGGGRPPNDRFLPASWLILEPEGASSTADDADFRR